jgi:hypothetical protein
MKFRVADPHRETTPGAGDGRSRSDKEKQLLPSPALEDELLPSPDSARISGTHTQ